MTKRFKIGDKVRLSGAGLENDCYASFRDQVLTVSSVATKYMPASQFYAEGQPAGYHPGFDPSTEAALYDCKNINVSLYDWELERA